MTFRSAVHLATLLAAVLVSTALLPGAPPGASAAPHSVEVTSITLLQPGAPALTVLLGFLHVAQQAPLGPLTFTLTLDPGVLLDLHGLRSTQWSWGLTEAYLQRRRGPFDLRVGVERIPLETARLMIPFTVEPVDVLGTRLGRAGVRMIWTPDPATRIRAAFLEDAGALFPALSIRRQFRSFELEGHALALAGGRAAAGLGGSGLAGHLVVYGEAWVLTAPDEARYAAGISGSIGNGIWMLETGNAAAAAVAEVIPEAGVRPQAAGQIAYRLSDDLAITGTARVLVDPDALRGQFTVQVSRTAGNADYSVSFTTLVGPQPRRDIITATVSYSF